MSPHPPGAVRGRAIKRVILDYEAGELILQVRAAHAAIEAGRPDDGFSVLSFEGRGEPQVFAVKFNKESVRVYPQARSAPSTTGGQS